MIELMRACHFLQIGMVSGHGNESPWPVGESRSLPDTQVVEPCKFGYHGSPSLWDALQYAPGPVACLVELSGEIIAHGDPIDKYAARSRKLIQAEDISGGLREFAADCAEHVLLFYEQWKPGDRRPRAAIAAARTYARGEIAAANAAAASAAASAAATAAAYAANNAANAANAAANAAANTAYAAAYTSAYNAYAAATAAAYAAAYTNNAVAAIAYTIDYATRAAGGTERKWQRARFEERFEGLFEA